jgi:hypothetical protein
MKIEIPAAERALIEQETRDAIERGYDHAKVEWRQMALECLYEVCLTMKTFTVNDFRDKVDASPIKTHDKRAMGGVINTARRLGWIEPTGDTIPSRVGHKTPMQIWRSLKCVTEGDAPKHERKIDII